MSDTITPDDIEFTFTNPSPYLQAHPELRRQLEEQYTELARAVAREYAED